VARSLTAEWLHVPLADQPEAIRRWRDRRDRLVADGCHYWIFASAVDDAAFLEFIEARDEATLTGARERAGMAPRVEILTELELS
jgi:hypothetical protein